MIRLRSWSTFGVALASWVLAACGGSGHGFAVATNPIHITNNTLPQTLSGESVNFCIPFTGGSGGPYLLDVIDGTLPSGVTTDNQTVCLVGRALEDGTFDFTLKLTDTGSRPFTTSTMSYHWVVPIGALVFATDTVLPVWVYNRFDSTNLVLAGGVPPYSCEVVIQDAMIDELLPTGLSIPPDSCSVVGAPTGIKTSSPFIYNVSVRARDHANDLAYPTPATVTKRFVITVLVPPIIIATTTVPNGKCGTNYTSKIDIVDGIPPFTNTLAVAVGSSTQMAGDLQSTGGVAKGSATSAYALDTTAGPYTGKWPEGLYMRELTGDIFGVPRRAGIFNAWVYYVFSNTLPTVPSQNAWKAFNFTMADGVPPNVALDPTFLVSGASFGATAPNNIADGEVAKPYSVQFKALNGVPADGFSDAPNETKRQVNGEVAGSYDWSATTWPLNGGIPPPGLTFTVGGKLSGTPTVKQGARNFNPSATDFQLPIPTSAGHTTAGIASISIGPDAVVITESTVANDNNTYNSHSANTTNNVTFEYQGNQTVEILEPFSAAATVRPLNDAKDLIPAHTSPLAPRTLAQTLANIDLMAVTVNPTWWTYDPYNLNPKGARSMQHGDTERAIGMDGYNEDLGWGLPAGSSYYQLGYSSSEPTFEHASSTAVLLPRAPSVTVDILNGVYNDGAQLYGFENSLEFGVFIVHTDGKIEIPAAFTKATSGFNGFGDAVLTSTITKVGAFRRPQMAVSPDGRFAAMKVKVDVNNFAEVSTNERIVLFSLTGEKPFAGASSRLITCGGTGVGGTSADGFYLYGDSLTLTNTQLYFVKGNNVATTGLPDVIYKDHWLYRAPILSGTAALVPAPATASTTWPSTANTVGNPLAMPFHRWGSPGASSVAAVTPQSTGFVPTSGGGFAPVYYPGQDPIPRGSFVNSNPTFAAPDFYVYQWANFAENSAAPHPMRVSADGTACAIIASDATGGVINSTNFQNYGIFVDYAGAASIREAAVRRRFRAPTRLAGCRAGDRMTQLYGWYDGPATQMEISDDGKTIAAVYNASTATSGNSGSVNAGSSGSREELIVSVSSGAGSDPWTGQDGDQRHQHHLPRAATTGASVRSRSRAMRRPSCSGAAAASPTRRGSTRRTSWPASSRARCTPTTSRPSAPSPPARARASCRRRPVVRPARAATPRSRTRRPPRTRPRSASGTGRRGRSSRSAASTATTATSSTSRRAARSARPTRRRGGSSASTSRPTRPWAAVRRSRPSRPAGSARAASGRSRTTTTRTSPSTTGRARADHRVGDHATSSLTTNGTIYFGMYNQPSNWKNNSTAITGGGPAYSSGFYDYSAYGGDLFAMDTNVGSNAVQLTSLGASTLRCINYIQPSRTGTKVAFQSSGGGQFGDHYANQENIRMVTNVSFTAGGALAGTPNLISVEVANGRAGPSMTFDASDTKFYYAWKTAATNENQMELVEVVLNAAGNALDATKTRRMNGVSGTVARFTVLTSGR